MAVRELRASPQMPALESGMRLSVDEFDRRYELRSDIKKAELVQGVVYVSSPVRIDEHAEPDNLMNAWVGSYAISHPGVRAAANGTVHLSPNDRVQPDAMLWKTEGGTAQIPADHYMRGAPELAVEIAASSASYDLNTKKDSYRRAGVQEYVVWVTEEDLIHWFALEGGRYVELVPDADGWTESRVFPGLRVHIERLLDGDATVILPGAV